MIMLSSSVLLQFEVGQAENQKGSFDEVVQALKVWHV
jgi:hypothetical protein